MFRLTVQQCGMYSRAVTVVYPGMYRVYIPGMGYTQHGREAYTQHGREASTQYGREASIPSTVGRLAYPVP